MRSAIVNGVTANHTDNAWREVQSDSVAQTLGASFRGAHSSRQRSSWAAVGASLHRAAQDLDRHQIATVKPLNQTIGDIILFGAALNHSIASNIHIGQRIARNADGQTPARALPIALQNAHPVVSVLPATALDQDALVSTVPQQWSSHLDPSWDLGFNFKHFHVMRLLAKRGYTLRDDGSHVVARQLLKATVDMLIKNANAEKTLVRKISKDLGYFGATQQEPIAIDYQSMLLREWMTDMLFGKRLEQFLGDWVSKVEHSAALTTVELRQVIRNWIYREELAVDTENTNYTNDAAIKAWLWQHVILVALPILALPTSGSTERMRLQHVNWGKIHAGLLLARQAGIDSKAMSEDEALDLGSILLAGLDSRDLGAELGVLFRLPAIFFAIAPLSWPRQNDAALLQRYFDLHDQELEQHAPMFKFQRLIREFKTRTQLAQEFIDGHCPQVDASNFLNFGTASCWSASALPSFSLTDVYQKQVDDVAAAFTALDKLMLLFSWGNLDETEIDFLREAEIQRMQVSFSAAHTFRPVVTRFAVMLAPHDLIIPLKSNVDVYSIRHGDEERMYAVVKDKDKYLLKQVGREPENYYALLQSDQARTDSDYRLTIVGDGPSWQCHANTLEALCEDIAEYHAGKFSKNLYDFGVDKTNLEKIGEVLLAFVPGYTCITEATKGNQGAAALACTMDIFSLLPVAGKLSSMSIKVGHTFYSGGLKAVERASKEMAARATLKAVLRDSSKEFARHGLLPASTALGTQEWLSLGLTVVRSIDPGVELVGRLGLNGGQRLIALGRRLDGYFPALKRTFATMENVHGQVHQGQAPAVYTSARLAGIDRDIPVVDIAGSSVKSRAVYVQIDLDSGQLFGRKYKLLKDGTLRPLPVSVRRRLDLLRTHGLGGKGAVDAGASYASSSATTGLSAEETVLLPSVLGAKGDQFSLALPPVQLLKKLIRLGPVEIEKLGGLAGLASLHQIDLSWLRIHLKSDGKLTGTGRDLLYGYYISEWMKLSFAKRKLMTARSFAEDNHLKYDIWIALVRVDGTFKPAGYDLLTRLETGMPLASPTPAHIKEWMDLPDAIKKMTCPEAFAVKKQISAVAFVNELKLVSRSTMDGVENPGVRIPSDHAIAGPSYAYPQPETGPDAAIHSAAGAASANVELPSARTIDKRPAPLDTDVAAAAKRVADGSEPLAVAGSSADARADEALLAVRSSFMPRFVPGVLAKNWEPITYEHVKVWRDLTEDERQHWFIGKYCQISGINPGSLRKWVSMTGELKSYGRRIERFQFGADLTREESRRLSVASLKAMSQQWHGKGAEAFAAAGGIQQLARDHRINPFLLSRYLAADASLTRVAMRWINLVENEVRFRPYLFTRLMPNDGSKVSIPITYEHIKIWNEMTVEQRRTWDFGRFARANNLSESVWHQCVNRFGQFRPDGKLLELKTLGRLSPDVNRAYLRAELIFELQPLFAQGIAHGTSMQAFIAQHHLDPAIVRRYYTDDGLLTTAGERLRTLFELSKITPAEFYRLRSLPVAGAVSAVGVSVPLGQAANVAAPAAAGSSRDLEQAVTLAASEARPHRIVRPWESSPEHGPRQPAIDENWRQAMTSAGRPVAPAPLPAGWDGISANVAGRDGETSGHFPGDQVQRVADWSDIASAQRRSIGTNSIIYWAANPVQLRQLALIDNGLPSLQDPLDPRLSILEQVEVPIDQLAISNWGELYPIFDTMPTPTAETVRAEIVQEIRDWLRNDGGHGERFHHMLEIVSPSPEQAETAFTVVAKRRIAQFEIMGSYAGGLLRDPVDFNHELHARGEDNVYSYLWQSADPDVNISAFGRSNILSVINTAESVGVNAEWANLAPVRVGNNLIFYLAKRTIYIGEELLVSNGDRFGSVE